MKIGNPDRWRQRLLSLKRFIEPRTEARFHTQRLQDKYAHPNDALFGRVSPILDGVEEYNHDEVVRPISVYDKGPKSLVALQSLPEKHDHFRRPR